MKVEEIMKKAMVVDDIKIKEVAKIMSEEQIGCLIIMNGEKISGIVTERDVMKNIAHLDDKVSKIMSKSVIVIGPSASIDKAAEIMTENKIKKLPVVDNGRLLGIITATDVVANSLSLNEDFLIED